MTKFEVGKFYAIGISYLSKTPCKCIKRTDKTVTFEYMGKTCRFKIKPHPEGETFFSYPLWADSFGEQKRVEYYD